MKKTVLSLALILIVLFLAPSSQAANVPSVEVLYMNHGPMQPVIKHLKETFSKFDGKIKVSWYDLDTAEGRKFMAAKGLKEHIPLVVWIEGTYSVRLPQGMVKFAGFPPGSGPEPFQGKWTIKDLEAALDQATVRR